MRYSIDLTDPVPMLRAGGRAWLPDSLTRLSAWEAGYTERSLSDEQFRFAGLRTKGQRSNRSGFRVVKEKGPEMVLVDLDSYRYGGTCED